MHFSLCKRTLSLARHFMPWCVVKIIRRKINCFIASMSPRAKKKIYVPFFEVARIDIQKPFVHNSDRNDAKPMHVPCRDMSWRMSNDCDNPYLASNINFRCPRAQKVQLCTIFRGRTDRHLCGVLVLIRDRMAFQVYSTTPKCFIKVLQGQS